MKYNILFYVSLFSTMSCFSMERGSEETPLLTRSDSSDSQNKLYDDVDIIPSPLSISECSSEIEEQPNACIIRVLPSAQHDFEQIWQSTRHNSNAIYLTKQRLHFPKDQEAQFHKTPRKFNGSYFVVASSYKNVLAELESQATQVEGVFIDHKTSFLRKAENRVRQLVTSIVTKTHQATDLDKEEFKEEEAKCFSKVATAFLFLGAASGITIGTILYNSFLS